MISYVRPPDMEVACVATSLSLDLLSVSESQVNWQEIPRERFSPARSTVHERCTIERTPSPVHRLGLSKSVKLQRLEEDVLEFVTS